MNWDSFESKNGRLASHDFRPGLQSIRAVTGRTGRFRSRDNSVCANFNHLDPALYCDWYTPHLHFLPPSVLNIWSRANCQKGWHWNSLSCKWWSFCLMAFTTNGECHSWYLASNIQKVPKKSGCWKNAVGYAAYCTQPPWKGSSPLLLTHIGANPLTGSYFIHHRRRQFVRQSRLSGGGINPRDGFATAHILPFFSAFCLTFPQLFRSRVLWAGKRGMTRLTAIIREDARSGLFLTSCTSWEFLYQDRQEQLSLFNPTNNFEKVKIVLDSTRSSFGFTSRHMCKFELKWSYSICQSINQRYVTPVCCFMFSFGRLVSSVLPSDGLLPPNHLLLHKGPTQDQPFGTISSSLICPKVDLHDIERPISSPQSGGVGGTQDWGDTNVV